MAATPYINLFREASAKTGVPVPLLLAFSRAESGLQHKRSNGTIVKSPAGAIGIMQLMPATARGMGFDPYDIRQNIMGGATYLANALKKQGSWQKAAEAYNAGPGAVTPAGQPAKYEETRNYVKRIAEYIREAGMDPSAAIPSAKGVTPAKQAAQAGSHGAGYTATPATTPVADGTSGDPMLEYDRRRTKRSNVQSLMSSNAKILKLPEFHLPSIELPSIGDINAYQSSLSQSVASSAANIALPTAPRGVTEGHYAGDGHNHGPGTVQTAAMFKPGKGWGGSEGIARNLAKLGFDSGLTVMSEKRDRRFTKSGGMSDHFIGNANAYAFDLSNGSQPTPEMDETARKIAESLGVKNWKSGVLNVNKNGYRIQLLYRTNVGGNHYNHVHVGVRKL